MSSARCRDLGGIEPTTSSLLQHRIILVGRQLPHPRMIFQLARELDPSRAELSHQLGKP